MDTQLEKTLLPFHSPCSILICGPTGSGKSMLAYKIIQQSKHMFTTPPVKTVYCYSAYQELFTKMEQNINDITFHEGLPSNENIEEWSKHKEPMLLILDYLLASAVNSVDIMNLFTIKSHHSNISVLFLMQNIFPQGKCIRTISLNASYIICLRSYRDRYQLSVLGKQILSGQIKYFMQSYELATKCKYGYLLIDLSCHTDKTYLLRTNIFVGEDNIIFVPK